MFGSVRLLLAGVRPSARIRLFWALAGVLAALPATAAVSGWRRDGTGSYPTAQPPTVWQQDRNIAWTQALGRSNASPAIAGKTIFVCEEPTRLVALDARSGKILWRREVSYADTLTGEEAANARTAQAKGDAAAAELPPALDKIGRLKREARAGPSPERDNAIRALESRIAELRTILTDTLRFRTPPTGDMIGYASSTPVTDGKAVYVVFATGVAAAFSIEGQRLWLRSLGELPHPMNGFDHGHATSPVLVDGKLIVGFGKLRAFDTKDGREVWAGAPYRDYGTPFLTRVGNVDVLITPEGTVVRATDGQTVARGLAALRYTGPVVSNGVAYFVGSWNPPPPVGDSVEARARAVRLTSALLSGGAPEVLFDVKLPEVRYYASPVIRDGLLYTVSQKGRFTVLNSETGAVQSERVIWQGGGDQDQYLDFFPSLASAGDYVFVSGTAEQVFAITWVLKPGPRAEVVSRNKLDGFMASPVFDGSRLYIRGFQGLQAIETKAPPKRRPK